MKDTCLNLSIWSFPDGKRERDVFKKFNRLCSSFQKILEIYSTKECHHLNYFPIAIGSGYQYSITTCKNKFAKYSNH